MSASVLKEAGFFEKLTDKKVRCFLCSHRCSNIADKGFGICGVRQNIGGVLYTLVYGKVIASHVDPIEKKPIFHLLPGSTSFSIATIGCNFRCGFCQNWQISQSRPKDKKLNISGSSVSPGEIVKSAKKHRCVSISYTYTEPTIFFEFAFDTAKIAKEEGLYNIFVTNGYMTGEALNEISPYLDAANVDLKSFSDEYYRKVCGAHLEPVLESIRLMKKLNIWVEITTLIIPGMNDSQGELTEIAKFIASVDKNIPWHISRFHPDYKFDSVEATPLAALNLAREVGKRQGLNFIYVGNCFAPDLENTYCPNCRRLLIKRMGFEVLENSLIDSQCPDCKINIAGRW